MHESGRATALIAKGAITMALFDTLDYEDRRALEALDEISRATERFGNAGVSVEETDADLSGVRPAQLCEEYTRLKPTIEIVLSFVARIPIYGSKIVAIIRMLMVIADTVCPLVQT
jgi:hypothetical protein